MKKKVFIYGSSTFIAGLKLSLENVEEFAVEMIKNPADFARIKTDDVMLIIEKNILSGNSINIMEKNTAAQAAENPENEAGNGRESEVRHDPESEAGNNPDNENLNGSAIVELLLEYPDLKIICLEPDKEDVSFIKKNIASVRTVEELVKQIMQMD